MEDFVLFQKKNRKTSAHLAVVVAVVNIAAVNDFVLLCIVFEMVLRLVQVGVTYCVFWGKVTAK